MESKETLDPADALAAAQEARAQMARSVSYPRWYVAGCALQAALLMVGAASLAPSVDAEWQRVLLGMAALVSLALAVVNLRRFEDHNQARFRGFRFARGASLAYLVVLVMLAVLVSNRANLTDAWWAGVAAAPVAALITVAYLRYWLVAYRREQA